MSDIISPLVQRNIASVFLGSPEESDPDDEFCSQLKFFIKLIYILTGECKFDFHWDIDRADLIKKLAPVSEISGYLSITSWLFAQIPQVIKNYSDKSVDGLSLGFLLCWFAGDFLNFTSCLMTDALMFQILLSGYYCIIDFILAGQYFYYSHLYYDPKSRFFYKKRSQRLNVLKSPRSRLRDTLEEHDKHINKMSKKKQSKTTKKVAQKTSKTSKKTPILVEIDADPNKASVASIPTEHIPIPNSERTPLLRDHFQDGEEENDDDDDEGDENEDGDPQEGEGIIRRKRNLGLFSTSNNNSFTKLISSSFIAGFTKVNAMPIPQDDFSVDVEITEKRKSALDKILLHLSAILHFLRYMDSHTMGKVFAWTCTFFYLTSRIPQLLKNYKLKSTKGISLKLFMCALVGNTLYSVSLATCKSSLIGGEESSQFWSDELSYIIGACGTVIFDIIVLIQWYTWDYNTKTEATPSHRGHNPHHHHPNHIPVQQQSQQQQIHLSHPNGNFQVFNKTTNQFKTIKPPYDRSIVISDQSSLNTSKTNMRSPLGGGTMGGSYSASSIMGGRLGSSSPFHSSSKPILILSPNHIRKLSEFTPLSPIDFLTEEYMSTNKSALKDKDKEKEKSHSALNRYQNRNANTTFSSTTSLSSTPHNNTTDKSRTYSHNNESAITIESSEHDTSNHNHKHTGGSNDKLSTNNTNNNNESNDNTFT